MTNAELFKQTFGRYATDVWSLPEDEFLKWLNADVQQKTGHWEQYGNSWEDKFKCSECGEEQPKILCGERIIGYWSDYCPNCGCRMEVSE